MCKSDLTTRLAETRNLSKRKATSMVGTLFELVYRRWSRMKLLKSSVLENLRCTAVRHTPSVSRAKRHCCVSPKQMQRCFSGVVS